MGFIDSIKSCFGKYVTFSGRAPRSEYWFFWLFVTILEVVGFGIDSAISGGDRDAIPAVTLFALFILFLPSLAVAVRRLHDTDRSGWWLFLNIVPLGFFVILVFMLSRGTEGENDFGSDPLAVGSPAEAVSGTPYTDPWMSPPDTKDQQPTRRLDVPVASARAPVPAAAAPRGPAAPTALDAGGPAEPQARRAAGPKTQLAGIPIGTAADKASDDPVVGWIVVVDGPGKGRSLPLGAGTNELARSPTARVPLDFGDDEVSRNQHAAITFDPRSARFFVQHGGGKNLTYLGDAPVLAPQELRTGQEISLGKTRLRFVALCGPEFTWQRQA